MQIHKYALTCENVGISVLGSVVFLKRGIRRKRLSRLNRLKKEKLSFVMT